MILRQPYVSLVSFQPIDLFTLASFLLGNGFTLSLSQSACPEHAEGETQRDFAGFCL
jgi:hypothetical protein